MPGSRVHEGDVVDARDRVGLDAELVRPERVADVERGDVELDESLSPGARAAPSRRRRRTGSGTSSSTAGRSPAPAAPACRPPAARSGSGPGRRPRRARCRSACARPHDGEAEHDRAVTTSQSTARRRARGSAGRPRARRRARGRRRASSRSRRRAAALGVDQRGQDHVRVVWSLRLGAHVARRQVRPEDEHDQRHGDRASSDDPDDDAARRAPACAIHARRPAGSRPSSRALHRPAEAEMKPAAQGTKHCQR